MPDEKITIMDVAQRAGVAPGTVSRTLSNTGYIKETTREKVFQAAKELHYIPNRAGRTLKTSRTGLIMLAIPDIANNIYTGMMEAVHERAKIHGCSMVIFFTNGELEGELKAIRMLQEHLVDGLFLVHFSYSRVLRESITHCSAPVVLCGMCDHLWANESGNNFSTLSIDVYHGIYSMTRMMLERGHRRFVYLAGIENYPVYEQRYKAFCDALEEKNIKVDPQLVFYSDYTQKNGKRAAKAVLDSKVLPDAVIASNDLQALGFWEEMTGNGYDVPGDLELCGMDNLDVMKMLRLHSIRMYEYEIGSAGAEILLNQLEQGKEKVPCCDKRFIPEIVIRKKMKHT